MRSRFLFLIPSLQRGSTWAGVFVDGQAIGQLTGEFVNGQTISQLTGEFVDGQTIGQLSGEFVDGQTIGFGAPAPISRQQTVVVYRQIELQRYQLFGAKQ